MASELFFEIRREKLHLFLDAEENQTVMDLKRMISGITHEPLGNIELWKIDEDGNSTQILHDTATLVECGYNSQNAKAQAPSTIGLRLISKDEHLAITDVSTPPPIPDTMRQDPAPTD